METSVPKAGLVGRLVAGVTLLVLIAGVAWAAVFNMTLRDFHLSGTQVGDVAEYAIWTSDNCIGCHSEYGDQRFNVLKPADPASNWKGSLMAQAGRDPLFYAQMTLANQDVENAGYFCMRCHVPNSFISGSALEPWGSKLTEYDMDGVSCHFCHSMVDPIYKPGVSPHKDRSILAALDDVPSHYGNAMFVLDPDGTRRGPRQDAEPMHELLHSPFHQQSTFCGTCHDVGNVAISRQKNGTYRYNKLDEAVPDEDLWTQFPLERTFTEWSLSAFAQGGVDMGGRFGDWRSPVMSSCQDCHMPRSPGYACFFGPARGDVARHEFAGSADWPLEIIALLYKDDPSVDQAAIARGRETARSMLRRAASLDLETTGDSLKVRVLNETGHKLPTGHIEGRRVFINVQYFDAAGAMVGEFGRYDFDEALLDEDSTAVFEMKVGLSRTAARLTGLPQGVTDHMALADTIEKDNRIPPRGFNNAAFEKGGAPVVGATYADGQHWADVMYDVPPEAVSATVTVYYQIVTRAYIEHLRDANVTDDWGQILYDLWEQTDRAPPFPMVVKTIHVREP